MDQVSAHSLHMCTW